jgi:hypothetical protein
VLEQDAGIDLAGGCRRRVKQPGIAIDLARLARSEPEVSERPLAVAVRQPDQRGERPRAAV